MTLCQIWWICFGDMGYVYGPRAEFFLSEKGKRVKVKRVLLTWSEVGLFYPTDAAVNPKGLPGNAKAYVVDAVRRSKPVAIGDTRAGRTEVPAATPYDAAAARGI